MKKIVFVLVLLALAAIPVTVYAGDGITNNPNHFEVDLDCEGKIIHATIPNYYGVTPGFTDDGRVVHTVTHKIDFEQDGIWDVTYILSHGRNFDTVFCTWTWDNDEFLHGMDIWFSSVK